jgi:hypothetical protein
MSSLASKSHRELLEVPGAAGCGRVRKLGAKCAPAVACCRAISSLARPVDADLTELRPEGRTPRPQVHPAESMQAWANFAGSCVAARSSLAWARRRPR